MPNTKKTPPPYKPMERGEFENWRNQVLLDSVVAAEMFDAEAFVNDVKRFNPKAAEVLQTIFDAQEKLYEALK